MDWKQILSFSLDNLTDLQKDEIYENLILLQKGEVEKKNYKKFFELFQHILKYKGEMVTTILSELEELTAKDLQAVDNSVLLEENVELKNILEKLDSDKVKYKNRIKELNDENAMLQRKLQDNNIGGSEHDDSPDALSEIDKQEELLTNITMKNKHIKRLLRDIEMLERQTSTQSAQIQVLRNNLTEATETITKMTNQLTDLRDKVKEQDDCIQQQNIKLIDTEEQLINFETEKQNREAEIQEFGKQLEERAMVWKEMLEEKDDRLDSLRVKYEEVLDKNPSYDIDSERCEMKRLTDAIKERDELIGELESKILNLTKEMIDSTDIMNRLAKERETTTEKQLWDTKQKSCCDESKKLWENSTKRCKELQDIITNMEEDNAFKSKQAMEAIETLNAYQSGEDGLAQAVKKNSDLQHKIQSRDKQIRALIMEINGMQEIAQENFVLRKRLGIPEDELVSTRSFNARQKKFEKITDRLTLKLRASEEIRLQLKLEKHDLKRQLSFIKNKKSNRTAGEENVDDDRSDRTELNEFEIKYCENCLKQYNTKEILKDCKTCKLIRDCNFCTNCQKEFKIGTKVDNMDHLINQIDDLESKYTIVVEENENLRIGMHEILEKLRNYNAESQNIVIESSILEKLLHALDARSISGWYHPAMRLQNELIASKEREIALKERVRCSEQLLTHVVPPADRNVEIETNKKPKPLPRTTAIAAKRQSIVQSVDTVLHNFENFVQQIFEQKQEIEIISNKLSEQTDLLRNATVECDKFKIFEENFNELTASLMLTDDEKIQNLAQQYEECVKWKNALNLEEKKYQFIQFDYDNVCKNLTKSKEQAERIIFEFKKELVERKHRNEILEKEIVQMQRTITSEADESDRNDLKNELSYLRFKVSHFSSTILKSLREIDDANCAKIDLDKMEKLGMIQNNFVVEFITRSEYDRIEMECKTLRTQMDEITVHSKHLEELLTISQEQIKSQQQMLTKSSEEEIVLRHLVVDMQSTSNEKYIIAKTNRELQQLHEADEELKVEKQVLVAEIINLKKQLELSTTTNEENLKEFDKFKENNELKLKFLSKSYAELRSNYHQFMPLYPINDFLIDYTKILECKRQMECEQKQLKTENFENELEFMLNYVRENIDKKDIEDKIMILKYQTKNEYLENQLKTTEDQMEKIKIEMEQQKLREINWTQHWNTIKLLFNSNNDTANDPANQVTQEKSPVSNNKLELANKETQTLNDKMDKCINTDVIDEIAEVPNFGRDPLESSTESVKVTETIAIKPTIQQPTSRIIEDFNNTQKSIESQLKQAMILASTRSSLLMETENRLAVAQTRIKSLERSLDEKDKLLKDERNAKVTSPRKDDNILSVTITSLQNLLLEKDTTLSRYQDLLRTERQDRTKSYDQHRNEIKSLQNLIDDLEIKLKIKERETEKLQTKCLELEETARNGPSQTEFSPKRSSAAALPKQSSTTFDPHDDYTQLSDKLIEDMFMDERRVYESDNDVEIIELKGKLQHSEEEVKRLQAKLRDVCKREKIWEKSLTEKDKENDALNERLNKNQIEFNEISENISNRREIDQLRDMLEEKDRHINDLTDTLTHFHDDQQKFINDTSLHSAEQVSQLSADLNRSEATNRILNTQLDALKRQIANLSQREKQARDLVKTLKTQLIRRPVISVKPERTFNNREEHLQKRVSQLESELSITKDELRKQTSLTQLRKSKEAVDLALWDKQKRFQQSSESYKNRLIEREGELEKLQHNFNTAKNVIARLEREKHILDGRLRSNQRYCQSPSCPNLHAINSNGTLNYTKAESAESYVDHNTEESMTPVGNRRTATGLIEFNEVNQEIVDILKARIESQQRKIIAMELDGRGSNTLTTEYEKLHEKLSNAEAQNLRLEARNLQLQLDNDMLKQGDQGERTQRQIKHLEDYIIALKSELAESINGNSAADNPKPSSSTNLQLEQTVLTLRRVVERLKVENKNLKESKCGTGSSAAGSTSKSNGSKDMYDKLRIEFDKIQKSYSESLDKISALQIELEIQNVTCAMCKSKIDLANQPNQSNSNSCGGFAAGSINYNDITNELTSLKNKLIKKTQLLEKAKILLTRAAAKEKNFKEQIIFWKRRCSELQNVPVIDEASE